MRFILPLLITANFLFGYTEYEKLQLMDRRAKANADIVATEIGNLHGQTLCSRKPNIAWQANGTWFPIPCENIFETCYTQQIKYILTDIEGTTSSIHFVYEVLFPYFREHLNDLTKHAQINEVKQAFADVIDMAAREEGKHLKPQFLR
jgi:hypothetical protein